jgi:hypothetical protein
MSLYGLLAELDLEDVRVCFLLFKHQQRRVLFAFKNE